MIITFTQQGEAPQLAEWEVWAQLDEGDPTTSTDSFIIGVGVTKREAALEAEETLMKAIEALHRETA